ncbi:MAG: hypothetical protein MJ200_03195 [Mycoplasmoidaceae bacterium]|nr:hypothetical protein [Mycoplasmoidaceae bacterium]
MYKVKVDFIPPGGSAEDVKHETLMEALADTFNVGLGNINGSTMDYKDPADRETIVNAVNNITDSWN